MYVNDLRKLFYRKQDLDIFVNILLEPWTNVRSIWEDHARYLFREHCAVHRILQEATFSNDEGVSATDTILVEVNKVSASDCIRRPLRLFQKPDYDANNNRGAQKEGNPNKEPVCELVNFKTFHDILKIIAPNLSFREVLFIFIPPFVFNDLTLFRRLNPFSKRLLISLTRKCYDVLNKFGLVILMTLPTIRFPQNLPIGTVFKKATIMQ